MKVRLTFCFLFLITTLYGQSTLSSDVGGLKKIIVRSQGIERSNALFELAKVYSDRDIDSTKFFLDEALSICRRLNNDTLYMSYIGYMQYYFGRVGENELAHRYLVTARDLTSPQSMIPKFRNLIYVGLYFAHYWNFTRYDSSVYYGKLTIDLAADSLSKADRLILVGAAYNKMGDNISALEYYNSAQAIMNALPYHSGEHCYLFNQLGMLYSDEGDLKKSESYYLKSIAEGRKAGGFPQVSPLTNLGVVYDRMGLYEKSLRYLDSASILLPTESDPWRTAINMRNQGMVLTHAGRPKEGIETTLKAMKMYEKLKDNYTVARLHLQLAQPYRMLGDYKTAEREALLALDWDRRHGYGELEKESYRELSRIYADTRQYGKAFEYQDRYLAIVDSLNSAERRNKFIQLEKNFEFAVQEKMRQSLEREKELILAQSKADREARIYLTVGTIVLAGAVIIAIVAYRRMRHQNVVLNDQNRKIEDQAQQLQEAAKTKSRFFANVSHELRTPVTLLNGMLELMKENISRNGINKKLEIALVNSRRLQGMLDEVLDLSRVEAGELKLSRHRKELLPLLKRIVLAFESLAARRNVRLEFKADALVGLQINIDEDKFEKVINNLVQNAVKFNREGGWIRVTADRTDTSVVIQVADSGIGIPEKDLPFVFDRFYQSASTEKLNLQGVGIGLSLVREFIELHGGTVTASSALNEGSCFTIQLPLDVGEVTTTEIEESISEVPEVNFNTFSRKPNILIVEDNEEMRYYLKEILGDYVSIEEAGNGNEGLKKLGQYIPDLIISDVMMPEMDGSEFLQHLKSSSAYRGIPVVMLTARAAEEDVLQGLSLGVDDYIIKPFNALELKIRIHNLLTNQGIRTEWSQKPRDGDEVVATTEPAEDKLFVDKVKAFVEQNAYNAALGVGDLCDHLAMSERQIYRKAATLTGMTPAQLIKEVKMKIAYRLLLQRKVVKVSDLAKSVGFENASYFSRQFEERFGKRPAEFL